MTSLQPNSLTKTKLNHSIPFHRDQYVSLSGPASQDASHRFRRTRRQQNTAVKYSCYCVFSSCIVEVVPINCGTKWTIKYLEKLLPTSQQLKLVIPHAIFINMVDII